MYQLMTAQARRKKRRRNLWISCVNGAIITYFIVVGSASGVILGALIVNFLWPDHILYQIVREAVQNAASAF